MTVTVTLEVTFMDNSMGFFEVNPLEGWKVRAADRVLVVGHGTPRMEIPLDNVRYYCIRREEG